MSLGGTYDFWRTTPPEEPPNECPECDGVLSEEGVCECGWTADAAREAAEDRAVDEASGK